jgi:predicted DNA-binding transcriptional regulator YafY
MEFIRQIERLQLLNKLVREQRTGSPDELAERLGVSRRRVYVYLEYLNDMGVDIQYSRRLNSFVFVSQKLIQIDWRFEVLDPTELKKVGGGVQILSSFLIQNFLRSKPAFSTSNL